MEIEIKGEVLLVDADWWEMLKRVKWSVNDGYFRNRQSMHRVIMDPVPEGLQVDHINRNKKDNRRENLRIVTRSENGKNRVFKPRKVYAPSQSFLDSPYTKISYKPKSVKKVTKYLTITQCPRRNR